MNNETDDLPSHETIRPAEPILPTRPSALRQVFIGKDGLRAGWSLLVFVALFAAFLWGANIIGHKLHPPDPNRVKSSSEESPAHALINESVPLLATILVTWVMSKIERRSMSVYGLGDSRKLAHFFSGLAWGVLCLSLLILTLVKSGLLVIDGRLLFGGNILRYGSIWLVGFLVVAILEEYLTRGYLQYTLSRGLASLYHRAFKTHSAGLGFWTSAVIFSILFGVSHNSNPGESPIGLLSVGLAGMVFCFSLWRTGSLWWAIGFHTSWDWGQSFLYGVADSGLMVQHHLLATHPAGKPILSGGTTGPEGSIFIVAIIVLISLILLFTVPRAHYGQEAKAFQ
ncbi:MAG TPA: CPBP family intramembrane glutamic endopeptidase [Terriglobales bacterium]|nr:CPBP family intramembrane glutamic endopeptidase [Terriglobales bacterium]